MGGLSARWFQVRESPRPSTPTSRSGRRSTGSSRPASCRDVWRPDVPDSRFLGDLNRGDDTPGQRPGRRSTARATSSSPTRRRVSTAAPASSRSPASATTTWTTAPSSRPTSWRRSMAVVPARSSRSLTSHGRIDVIAKITGGFDGVHRVVSADGASFFSFDPEVKFPFATLVNSNAHDQFSDLDRPTAFRLKSGSGRRHGSGCSASRSRANRGTTASDRAARPTGTSPRPTS